MLTATTFPIESSNISPGFQARIETNGIENPEILRLRSKNELWNVYAPEWNLYLSAYEGGPDFANGDNIFKHQRENPDDFNDRASRLHYFNYCDELVDFFTGFIFAETIQRDGGANAEFYQTFITDVNKKGDSVTDYMKLVSDDMQIFGMSFTLVDTPRVPLLDGNILTKQQEEDMGLRPYWVLIKPAEITDWIVDEFEILQYAKRMQPTTKLVSGVQRHFEKYTEWFTDHTEVSWIDVTNPAKPELIESMKEAVENRLGFIPLVCARYKRSKRHPYMGNSFLRDFAYNNREVLNYTSLLQEFLYRQAFNILAKEVDTSIPLRDQQDGVLGTSNVLEYPKGAEAPKYISPPVDPAKFIAEERQRIVNEMFKRAAQDTLNELFNGEKSSGFSQAQSFSKTVPFIAGRADTLEKAENAFMALTMKLINKSWDGKIKYKDRYELTNITDAITQLTSIFRDLYMPSETFVKEELKRLVHEMDGKIPIETMATILKEIDDMNFSEWQEVQKQALIGQPKSPADQQKNKSSGTIAEASAEARSGATNKLRA
jgi:hypothetical protein